MHISSRPIKREDVHASQWEKKNSVANNINMRNVKYIFKCLFADRLIYIFYIDDDFHYHFLELGRKPEKYLKGFE